MDENCPGASIQQSATNCSTTSFVTAEPSVIPRMASLLKRFYNENGEVISAIIGSANLGVIKLEASNRRQYELSAITEEPAECNELATHIRQLQSESCSARIDSFTDLICIRNAVSTLQRLGTQRDLNKSLYAVSFDGYELTV